MSWAVREVGLEWSTGERKDRSVEGLLEFPDDGVREDTQALVDDLLHSWGQGRGQGWATGSEAQEGEWKTAWFSLVSLFPGSNCLWELMADTQGWGEGVSLRLEDLYTPPRWRKRGRTGPFEWSETEKGMRLCN